MQEQWNIWEPIRELTPKYRMKYINDNFESFIIRLVDDTHPTRELSLLCKDGVESYRFVKEPSRKHTLDILARDYEVSFFENWTFFKVEHSHYKALLVAGSQGTKGDIERNLHHFVLITSNATIGIIDYCAPQVEFIQT